MSVQDSFRSVCRTLLGSEVGELEDFRPFLSRYTEELMVAESAGGKPAHYSAPYCTGARFLSFEEALGPEASRPVDIDDTKDIDSLLSAVSARFSYAGNKVLGNSRFVEASENCIDSLHVLGSSEIFSCRYVAYSNLIRDSKYMFGCSSGGDSSFAVNCAEISTSTGAFESGLIFHSSNVYYSYYVRNCREVFFCFSLVSGSYAIGNNVLGKERYLQLKKNLLEQVADELGAKGSVPSLIEMVCHG